MKLPGGGMQRLDLLFDGDDGSDLIR